MTVIGGEIGQLYGLKSSFERESAVVDALLRELRGQLSDTYWSGGAADRFRAAWHSEYEPALTRLAEALQEAATEVGRRAGALEQVGS
jgi:WXG100 family type VII secretion target